MGSSLWDTQIGGTSQKSSENGSGKDNKDSKLGLASHTIQHQPCHEKTKRPVLTASTRAVNQIRVNPAPLSHDEPVWCAELKGGREAAR